MRSGTRQALVGLGALAVILFGIAALASTANTGKGLRVQVLSARRTEPATREPFTVSVNDTRGAVTSVRIDFGDGRVEQLRVDPQPCRQPLVRQFTVEHSFDFTGFSTVSATVETDGCGAGPESVEAIRTVEVREVRR